MELRADGEIFSRNLYDPNLPGLSRRPPSRCSSPSSHRKNGRGRETATEVWRCKVGAAAAAAAAAASGETDGRKDGRAKGGRAQREKKIVFHLQIIDVGGRVDLFDREKKKGGVKREGRD